MNTVIERDLQEIANSPIVDWTRFKNKVILVTGANGMLPAYIVFALLYQGKSMGLDLKVIAQVRNMSRAKDVFKDYLNEASLCIIEKDVIQEYSTSEKIDFIIHAASQASPKYYETDPVGTLMANVQGTMNVLNLAHRQQCESVLFFSSAEVYGRVNTEWIDENAYGYLDPCDNRACYSESKRMGEQMCIAWNKQYGTHCKIVRPFHTYAPTMRLDDGRVFADFVKSIVSNENIILKSSGESRRAFCYVTDATIGFLKVLLDGRDSEAYNVGNPSQSLCIRDLAQMLLTLYPSSNRIVFDVDESSHDRNSRVNSALPSIEKMRILGWTPCVSVQDGFKRVVRGKIEEMRKRSRYENQL